jgi:hypothetical protein
MIAKRAIVDQNEESGVFSGAARETATTMDS